MGQYLFISFNLSWSMKYPEFSIPKENIPKI